MYIVRDWMKDSQSMTNKFSCDKKLPLSSNAAKNKIWDLYSVFTFIRGREGLKNIVGTMARVMDNTF